MYVLAEFVAFKMTSNYILKEEDRWKTLSSIRITWFDLLSSLSVSPPLFAMCALSWALTEGLTD